jgi:mannose-6-phosphate isomerase-like protein (cupin superfamily)
MIRKAEDMFKEIKEQMRGGKGSVEITHMFKQEELKGKARLCAKLTLNPGCSIGLHEHSNEEEIFYVIKGKGLINDNGSTMEVSVGDAILTGGGATHSVENNGTESLELLAVILLY